MNVKLLSNFTDFYDHHFDLDGEVFDRRDNIGMDRRQMFEFFGSLGLKTPFHGTLKEVFEHQAEWCPAPELQHAVVYLDLNSHRGNDKIQVRGTDPYWQQFQDDFAAEFIPTYTQPNIGISYRYLQIGPRKWWLEYISASDWRSNYGDVKINILAEEAPGFHPKINYPLYVVDFLLAGGFYAIDFNQSPGLRGTGIENILKPQEVVDLIKEGIANAKESA